MAGRPLLVGFSGGLDSTVLLQLLASDPAFRAVGVRAIHVDHGLHSDAARWSAHCRDVCDALGVGLTVTAVDVDRDRGRGIEAAAREARHAAFEDALADDETLVLAHHQDDQAETLLLRALRGSGPDGLAAMRPWRAFGRGWLWRPLLGVPRSDLLEHARQQDLRWIEDPSNADPALDRNFLRLNVLPMLQARWPHAAHALARSAALCAEASVLLADEDAHLLGRLQAADPSTLDAPGLRQLPPARRSRILRAWIGALGLPPLPAQGVERIVGDLLDATADAQACFAWSGAVVHRWRERLHARRERPVLPASWRVDWDGSQPLHLPGGGAIELAGAEAFETPVSVHARQGGERIVLAGRSHSHALKHLLQEAALPPWERALVPLLCSMDGEVLAAGDVVVSSRMAAWLGGHGARLVWSRL
jgi:tRNA(Ile)-lysidine synthase